MAPERGGKGRESSQQAARLTGGWGWKSRDVAAKLDTFLILNAIYSTCSTCRTTTRCVFHSTAMGICVCVCVCVCSLCSYLILRSADVFE